ncbi:glycoside-pentoside-hexuronide (GPH):cation symporter [Aestuariibacter sp. A3R04]|uniref:MFS transporter n=1 Tax=Aestuariibacter sp. A3R04 TaxID=2841571 RepID=UPI001C090545|nr:glycoside-pentoside-hexuronide (GPH):cation symporter [Aestuariibacter sp. A3R04]
MTSSPLSRAQSLGYAGGNFGKNIVANTLGYFLLIYITDVLGIDPNLAGIIVLVALIVDAVLDPLIGCLSDRKHSRRFGKYGRYIIFGAPLCSLSFVSIFYLPLVTENPVTTVFACLLLFRASYTLIDLPHNALLSRISDNSRERAHVATQRFFFSSIGSLCVTVAAFELFGSTSTVAQATLFQEFAVFAASVSVIAVWLSWYAVRERDVNASQHVLTWSQQISGLKFLIVDSHAIIILVASFFCALTVPIFTKGFSYFCKYNLSDQTLIAKGLTLMVIAQTVSTPVWSYLSTRFEKHHTLIAAHGVNVLSVLFFIFFVTDGNALFTLGCLLVGAAAGGLWSVIWGMAPDVIDKVNCDTKIRSEALFIALVVVLMKIGHGLSASILGHVLTDSGYVANSAQSDVVLDAIRWVTFGFPVFGAIICVASLCKYRLGHAQHEQIQTALQEQRELNNNVTMN